MLKCTSVSDHCWMYQRSTYLTKPNYTYQSYWFWSETLCRSSKQWSFSFFIIDFILLIFFLLHTSIRFYFFPTRVESKTLESHVIKTDPVHTPFCLPAHHCLFIRVCVCVHSGWLLFWQWRRGWCGGLLEVCQSKTNQSCLYFLALPLSALQSCSNQALPKSQQLSSNAPNCSPGTIHQASAGCWSRGKVKAHHKFHCSVYQQPRLTFTCNCLYWSLVYVLLRH